MKTTALEKINVFLQPSGKSVVIATIDEGDDFIIQTDVDYGRFYKIVFRDKIGYIFKEIKYYKTKYYLVIKSMSVFKEPNISSQIVLNLKFGDIIEIWGIADNWYKVVNKSNVNGYFQETMIENLKKYAPITLSPVKRLLLQVLSGFIFFFALIQTAIIVLIYSISFFSFIYLLLWWCGGIFILHTARKKNKLP